ncbi:MAG: exopolysaccharide biosynthesis polyprenyl glycosylphosphotransferase [Pseudomonadota bacterium]
MTKTVDSSVLATARRALVASDGAVVEDSQPKLLTDWFSATGAKYHRPGRSNRTRRFAVLMVMTDLLAIVIGFVLAAMVADGMRMAWGQSGGSVSVLQADRLRELVPLSLLALGVFAFGGLYRRSVPELDEIRRIVGGVGLVALFDATLQFILRDHSSRLWFMAAYPLIAVNVIALRMAVRSFPAVRQSMTSYVVLLGSGIDSERLVGELRESRATPVKLMQEVSLTDLALDGHDPKNLSRLLDRMARRNGVPVHRLLTVLAPSPTEIDNAKVAIAMLTAAERPYSVVLPFDDLARDGLSLHKVVGADMVMADIQPRGSDWPARVVKRLFDMTLTLVGLVVILPVMAIISVLLMLEGGPVLFAQTRIGRDGQRFCCYKFRTMRKDAEGYLAELLASDPAMRQEWETYQKLSNDPRITPLGAFLRKTSMDELPQLFNVLRGEMSLVGPRPIVSPDVPGYPSDHAYFDSDAIDHYIRCTPGITGLWQVAGRASTTHKERVRLDCWYARNWSFWLDLMILFKTVRVVLVRQGSH